MAPKRAALAEANKKLSDANKKLDSIRANVKELNDHVLSLEDSLIKVKQSPVRLQALKACLHHMHPLAFKGSYPRIKHRASFNTARCVKVQLVCKGVDMWLITCHH